MDQAGYDVPDIHAAHGHLLHSFLFPVASTRDDGWIIENSIELSRLLHARGVDLIAIGREALTDPHWTLHAAQALSADPGWSLWPPSYDWWLELRDRTGVEV